MLLPLLCIIFALQAMEWRLNDFLSSYRHDGSMHEPELWQLIPGVNLWWQSLIVWLLYLATCHTVNRFVHSKAPPERRFYLTPIMQVFVTVLFTLFIEHGCFYAFEIMFYVSIKLDILKDEHYFPFIKELLLLIPFVMGHLIIMMKPGVEGYGINKRSFSSSLRFMLLLLTPFLFVRPWIDLLQFYDGHKNFDKATHSMPLVSIIIFLMISVAPSLLKFVMKTRPFPEGEVRDTLTGMARDLKIKYNSLREWIAGDGVINAAVVGTLPPLRYLVMTRGMVETFSLAEIKQVFWHEFGHIKHKHMWTYFLFFNLISNTAILLSDHFGESLNAILLSFGTLALWGIGFSYVSRRLEKQADLYALTHSKEPVLFIDTLRKLSEITGIPYKFYSLTHGSIQQRVSFLERCLEDNDFANTFTKRLALLTRTLWFLFWCQWVYWLSLCLNTSV